MTFAKPASRGNRAQVEQPPWLIEHNRAYLCQAFIVICEGEVPRLTWGMAEEKLGLSCEETVGLMEQLKEEGLVRFAFLPRATLTKEGRVLRNYLLAVTSKREILAKLEGRP